MLNVFGIKIRTEIVLLVIVLLAIMYGNTIFGTSKVSVKEGFAMLTGAPTTYKMGEGVKGSWDTRSQEKGSSLSWRKQPHETYSGTPVPLPAGEMFLFSQNKFSPECCGSTYSGRGGVILGDGEMYSSGSGCACMTKEQIEYINQRGGNRTHSTEF